MRALLTVIFLQITVFTLHADEATHRKGVEAIMGDFMKAWNGEDVEGFVSLFHPESREAKTWKNEAKREGFVKGFERVIEVFGKMKNYKTGLYIKGSDRLVLKIEYAKKETVAGTISVKKVGDDWKITDWNIDGQGEPELRK